MKNKIKMIITILLVVIIPSAMLLVPFKPENAVRLKLLSTGYVVNAFLSNIQLTTDMGPYQHCTYFCNDSFIGSKHGYRVKEIPNSPWYIAEQL